MTMSTKSKAYLVGGGIGSLAAARPGSVGVLDPHTCLTKCITMQS
jgi:hypothetical protein